MEDNIIEYGTVSDVPCPHCAKCSEFTLSSDYVYTKILFITMRERNHKYFLRCKDCGTFTEIDAPKARYMIETKFGEAERKRKRRIRLRNAIPVAVILALAAVLIYSDYITSSERFKDLVADKPDGYYEIYDRDGSLKAAVTKDGASHLSLFVRKETIYAANYSDIDDDLYIEHYYSEQDGKLQYIEDSAAVMHDKLGVGIRYFYYDPEEDDIFYYFGVDDFQDIEYSGTRAEYPLTLYSDSTEYYTKVYDRNEYYEISMLFDTSALQEVKLYELEDGRVKRFEYYDVSDREAQPGVIRDITKSTDIEEVVKALRRIQPAYSEEFSYYKDTQIVESSYLITKDAGTGMEVTKQFDNDVEEKGGWYIVIPDTDDYLHGETAA